MAKEACGGRDFTVVTMGIHTEKWKRKKNIEKERRGGTEAAGNEKRGRRKEKRKQMSWVLVGFGEQKKINWK